MPTQGPVRGSTPRAGVPDESRGLPRPPGAGPRFAPQGAMGKHARALAAFVLLPSLGGSGALATEQAPILRQRIGVDVGVASAVGLVGAAYQLALVPWLWLEGGIGYGP